MTDDRKPAHRRNFLLAGAAAGGVILVDESESGGSPRMARRAAGRGHAITGNPGGLRPRI